MLPRDTLHNITADVDVLSIATLFFFFFSLRDGVNIDMELAEFSYKNSSNQILRKYSMSH
jgi:3-phosphoglycerate kinase